MSLPPEIQGVIDNRECQREFIAALAALQAEAKDPEKSATNPHFKSKFTDLHTLLVSVRPLLAKHGFAVTQTMGYRDGVDVLTTTLWHKGGFSVSGDMRLALAQQTPQGMGSAVTYAKRYSLSAILGLASRDEDDDGEAAERPQRAAPARASAPKQEAFGNRDDALRVLRETKDQKSLADWGERVKASKEWLSEQDLESLRRAAAERTKELRQGAA